MISIHEWTGDDPTHLGAALRGRCSCLSRPLLVLHLGEAKVEDFGQGLWECRFGVLA